MKQKLKNLWRAELRKEAALWWESLSQIQQNDWACGRTEDEVVDDMVAAKIAVIQKRPYPVRYRYEEKYGYH